MNELNGISIVIATKGRVKLLGDLLKSVYEARGRFDKASEVLLVDDSSPSDAAQIEALCGEYDARRIEFGPSVAEKRNVGARAARYDIILFLDSDCIATEELLNEHFRMYTDEKVGAVAGLLEFVGEDTWFWKAVSMTPFVVCFGFPGWMDEVPWTPTANCSVRKDVFEKVNGFDQSFPDKPGGEDVDLGLRITGMGYVMKCNKKALVYHSKKTWIPVKAMIRRLWHYGSADWYLVSKHPKYLMNVLPRKPLTLAAGLLAILLSTAITLNPLLLILLLLWPAADLALTTLFFHCFGRFESSSYLKQAVVQLLIFDNELGYVTRCILKRKPADLFKNMVYFDGQMDGMLENGSIKVWSDFVSFAVLFSALFIVTLI